MTKQPETQEPKENNLFLKERNAMELSMYRSMGKRRCYRVNGDEPEADVFRFRNERSMVVVYDFTLAGKEAYGFDDLCALYGRMKALRRMKRPYILYVLAGKQQENCRNVWNVASELVKISGSIGKRKEKKHGSKHRGTGNMYHLFTG